jgi:anti-anti-sigma factor
LTTAAVPCELVSFADHVSVVLRPAVTQSSWSEVEAFGADVRHELERREAPACLVDLSPLDYMGSAIVALIVRIWKVVQARGGKMVVICANPAVLEVIRLAGLDKLWTITSGLDDAQRKLGLRSGLDATEVALLEGPVARPATRLWYFALGAATALIALMFVLLVVSHK